MENDEAARHRRAEELRRSIEEAATRPPATPRELADQAARRTASQDARERPDAEED